MARHAALRFVLVLVSLAAAQTARGDSSLAATTVVSTGFSDNILGVPETDDPLAPQVESDLYLEASPGVIAAYETQKSLHNLGYLFTARLFVEHAEANSFSNQLEYKGLFFLSPVSTLRVNASGAGGRLNNFDRTGGRFVDVGQELPPAGDVAFVSGQVAASYRRLLSRFWSYGASIGLRGYTPTNTDRLGSNYAVPGSLSLQRTFRSHILGTSLVGTFTSNSRPGDVEDEQAVVAGSNLFWTWDISRRWSSYAYAGLMSLIEAPGFRRGVIEPVGGATLNFTEGRGRASARYQHDVTANIFTADITVSDLYALQVNLPVPWIDDVGVDAAVAYRTGRFVNFMTEELSGTTRQLTFDLGTGYAINQAWVVGARYQAARQDRENPITGERFGLARRTFLVVVTGRFPTRIAASVPPEGVRVDEADALVGGQGDEAEVRQ